MLYNETENKQRKAMGLMKLNLAQKNLDAMLVSKPENIRYLTGYTGDTGMLLITGEKQYLFTDFRYEEQAKLQAADCQVVTAKGDYVEPICQLCSGTVGFEGRAMTWSQGDAFQRNQTDCRWVDVSGWLEELRAVKTEEELALIQRASEIAQEAFWQTLEQVRPGLSEREIAAELDYRMRRLGAERTSFSTIAVGGANSSLVHGEPGDYRLQNGDFLLLDFGCVYQGYCSDMTRTVGIGSVSQRQKEIYRIVKEAQQAALEAIKPGVPLCQVDRTAREMIEKAGYGDRFGHSLGHGVGLEIHEMPTLSPKAEGVLKPGMAVTVEPGIYLDGEFGVRIEDLVVIRQEGYLNLCSQTPKELLCIG